MLFVTNGKQHLKYTCLLLTAAAMGLQLLELDINC